MSAVANRMCAAPAGGLSSWVQVAPPSVVVSSAPLPSAQPCSVETKLTSCTSIGTAAATLGDAEADGLAGAVAAVAAGLAAAGDGDGVGGVGGAGAVAAVAAGLAAAEGGEAVVGGAAAGLNEPQPASVISATAATSVAAVTERRLLISPETPHSASRLLRRDNAMMYIWDARTAQQAVLG